MFINKMPTHHRILNSQFRMRNVKDGWAGSILSIFDTFKVGNIQLKCINLFYFYSM